MMQWANYVQVRVSHVQGVSRPDGTPLEDLADPLIRHLCNPTLPELLCTSRALLKKMEVRPAVGDKVRGDWERDGRGDRRGKGSEGKEMGEGRESLTGRGETRAGIKVRD